MSDQQEQILERLDSLEDEFKRYNGQLSDIGDDVGVIKGCLVGNLKGDKPGLAERIRAIEKWIESRKRFEWLLITIFLGQVVAFAFFIIQSTSTP